MSRRRVCFVFSTFPGNLVPADMQREVIEIQCDLCFVLLFQLYLYPSGVEYFSYSIHFLHVLRCLAASFICSRFLPFPVPFSTISFILALQGLPFLVLLYLLASIVDLTRPLGFLSPRDYTISAVSSLFYSQSVLVSVSPI